MEPSGKGGSDGTTAAEAFAILGNETRVEILVALWRADGPVPFAELRRTVAPEDTGNFNYHLKRLTGHFVEKTDDGYRLQFAGEQVVRAVVRKQGESGSRHPPLSHRKRGTNRVPSPGHVTW